MLLIITTYAQTLSLLNNIRLRTKIGPVHNYTTTEASWARPTSKCVPRGPESWIRLPDEPLASLMAVPLLPTWGVPHRDPCLVAIQAGDIRCDQDPLEFQVMSTVKPPRARRPFSIAAAIGCPSGRKSREKSD